MDLKFNHREMRFKLKIKSKKKYNNFLIKISPCFPQNKNRLNIYKRSNLTEFKIKRASSKTNKV